MKNAASFEKKYGRKMEKAGLPESDFYKEEDTLPIKYSRKMLSPFSSGKALIPGNTLPAKGAYQSNHTLNQNPTGMIGERTGSKPIPRGPLKYDDSHILRTPVLSKVCFCPPKIILSAKNSPCPNRDVGGGENSKVVFPDGRHIENKI